MYCNCTTEKSAQRQRALTMALLEALKTRSIHDISISELCRSSGVSRKQFYQLFNNKTDVVLAMLDQAILEIDYFDPDPSVAPGELHRFLAFWKSRSAMLDVLIQNHMSSLLIERCVHHVLHESHDMLDIFGVRQPEYAREMMMFYLNGIFSLVIDWHCTGYTRSIDEMCDLLAILMQKSPVKPW